MELKHIITFAVDTVYCIGYYPQDGATRKDIMSVSVQHHVMYIKSKLLVSTFHS